MSRREKENTLCVLSFMLAALLLAWVSMQYCYFKEAFIVEPTLMPSPAEIAALQPQVENTIDRMRMSKAFWQTELSICTIRERGGHAGACKNAQVGLADKERKLNDAIFAARWYQFSIPPEK
jgi:hypothetical protein